MQAALALLPSAVVLLAVLVLRWSGLAAAIAASVASLALWFTGVFAEATPVQLAHAAADATVLTVLVAAMTVPGILFVEATRRCHAPEAIGALVASIGLPKPQAVILIAIGFGVMLESLTGMGVSLLITIPLLLRISTRREAMAAGLLGMSLMPWGALAISAHLGAKLAALPIDVLARSVALVSGPVAFCLPILCLLVLRAFSVANLSVALFAGATLYGAISAATWAIGVEVAGVLGGLAVIMLMVALARSRNGFVKALIEPGLRPYLWLLAAVFAQKLIAFCAARMGFSPTLSTGRVDFAILTSPGVALLAATLISSAGAFDRPLLATVAMRAWRPIASIALFMLAARLLIECGAIAALASLLKGLGGVGTVVAVVWLGAVSGFVTGSGVTGNALFMPSAAAVGESLAQVPLYAALQNGAAGHVAMASLPVAAILLASLPSREPGDDRLAMRLGLNLGLWHVAVLTIVGLALRA